MSYFDRFNLVGEDYFSISVCTDTYSLDYDIEDDTTDEDEYVY